MKCLMQSILGPSEEAMLVIKFHVFYEILNCITFQLLQNMTPWSPVKMEAEGFLQGYVML
jgi:hypothetical protein